MDLKSAPQLSTDVKDRSNSSILERATSHSESIEDSPIEEVRASIPPTDDPTLPTATLRAWIWGIIFSAAISFTNQVNIFQSITVFIN